MIQLSQIKKLEKWVLGWLKIVKHLLNCVPQVKLLAKKNHTFSLSTQNLDSQLYQIQYNEEQQSFLILSKNDQGDSVNEQIKKIQKLEDGYQIKNEYEQIQDEKISNEDIVVQIEDGLTQKSKRSEKQDLIRDKSKREKKINKFLMSSDIALYNPNNTKNLDFESTISKMEYDEEKEAPPLLQKRSYQKQNKSDKQIDKKKQFKYQEQIQNAIQEDHLQDSYCICRKGHDGICPMFQCDQCQEWFHNSCLSIKSQTIKQMNSYYCMGCCLRYSKEYQIKKEESDFKWDIYKKLTMEQYQQIIDEGDQIPFNIDEKKELELLNKQIQNYILNVKDQISQGAQYQYIQEYYQLKNKDKQIQEKFKLQIERDQKLFQLVLEGIYLPIKTNYFDIIIRLLQRRDFANKVCKFSSPGNYSHNKIAKFWMNDFEYLKLNEFPDPNLSALIQISKNAFDNQKNYQKSFDQLLQSKGSYDEFAKIIKQAESMNLQLENIDQFKKNLNDFKQWENVLKQCINSSNKLSLDQYDKLLQNYDNFICSSPIWYSRLQKICSDGKQWLAKAWKYTESGFSSEQNEDMLLKESLLIPCKLPLVDYLEQKSKNRLQNFALDQNNFQNTFIPQQQNLKNFQQLNQQYNDFQMILQPKSSVISNEDFVNSVQSNFQNLIKNNNLNNIQEQIQIQIKQDDDNNKDESNKKIYQFLSNF